MKQKRSAFLFWNGSYNESDFVVFGVPDDSGSAYRKGSRDAPDGIRLTVNSNEIGGVVLKNGASIFEPGMSRFSAKVHDAGNFRRKGLKKLNRFAKEGKVIVGIGGDHSITADILEATRPEGKWGIVYFDAHPDFISSRGRYFGSVMHDVSKLDGFDPSSSILIGVRTPEEEEIENIEALGIRTITPQDIEKNGINRVAAQMRKIMTKKFYISIDMDVVDPAYAPGVTEPEPGGISSSQLIYLIESIASRKTFGVDVTEVVPKYDRDGITMYLAYRVLLHAINSISNSNAKA